VRCSMTRSVSSILTTTLLAALPSSVHPFQAAPLRSASRVAAPPCMSAVGQLLRLTVGVKDSASCVQFYEGLGLSSSTSSTGTVLVGGDAGAQLELREAAAAAHQPDGGFQGISVRVPSVPSAVEAAMACGGTVLSAVETIEHGPSWKPIEEPDEEANEIVEAVVADPSGYPVLLHESQGSVAISAVRCECHTWKSSQDWYEALGWTMRRYNSNVHREASLTLSLGADAQPCGPRGDESGAVLQLMYRYGRGPVTSAGGLEAIVIDAGTRMLVGDAQSEELSDPDGYAIRLEK